MADGDDRQATFGSDGSLRPTDDAGRDRRQRLRRGEGAERDRRRVQPVRRLQPPPEGGAPLRRGDRRVGRVGAGPLRLRLEPLGPPEPLRRRRPPGWQRRGPHDRALRGAGHRALGARRVEGSTLCDPRRAGGRPRARSTREASNADAYFSAVAEVRAEAHERDEPAHDFPVGDLEPEGQFDAIFDGHTGGGARGATAERTSSRPTPRVGPEGEDDQSALGAPPRIAVRRRDRPTTRRPTSTARSNRWTPKTRGGQPATESGRDYTDETTGAGHRHRDD